MIRYHFSKQSGADFVINGDIAVQVRMPLIGLYDNDALSTLSDEPKKENNKRQSSTLDNWLLLPSKKVRSEEREKEQPKEQHDHSASSASSVY